MASTTHNQPVAISPVTTQESRPVPDPTVLTTQQLFRAIEDAKELVETRLQGIKELYAEKFDGVAKQFENADKALAAALEAAKEAVGTQNDSFTKQIDQQLTSYQQAATNTDGKINDLKDRLTAIENRSKGAGDFWGYLIAVVMALIAIGALGVTVAIAMKQ